MGRLQLCSWKFYIKYKQGIQQKPWLEERRQIESWKAPRIQQEISIESRIIKSDFHKFQNTNND